MWPGNEFQALSNFQDILGKKESEEARVLIRTKFESFANTYLIQVVCLKNLIFQ